jgi:hypothetical protein
MTGLVAILGRGDRLSHEMANAVVLLVRETMWRESPHELETVTAIGLEGPREIRILPRAWIARLEAAAARGAFQRLHAHEIVQQILTTEGPGQ